MDMTNFYKFEEQLYAAGAGKDGLVIDVRENGGGSTADHLLTALTQPVHAVAVPRGGGPGYPNDRKVYATWNGATDVRQWEVLAGSSPDSLTSVKTVFYNAYETSTKVPNKYKYVAVRARAADGSVLGTSAAVKK